jgi:hypothetical protein
MGFLNQNGLFLSQVFFSLVGTGFSIGMLIKGEDASIYLPILTTIIGVWTPNPLSMRQPSTQEIVNAAADTVRSRLAPLSGVRVVQD